MTQDEFVQELVYEPARRRGHFEPADVRAFVAAEWTGIEEDPGPVRWADEFLRRGYLNAGP
jgi:hypothetical protein